MPQLLRNVLDGGMVFVELDRGITMPEIMQPIYPQSRPGTQPAVDQVQM